MLIKEVDTNDYNERQLLTPDSITFSKATEFKLQLAELSSQNVPGPASLDSAESIDVVMQSVVKRASPPIRSNDNLSPAFLTQTAKIGKISVHSSRGSEMITRNVPELSALSQLVTN